MIKTAIDYLLRFGWSIIFMLRLHKLLKRIPCVRNIVSKPELIQGGVDFDMDNFVKCASSGQLYEVSLFIRGGIRFNIPDKDGVTALVGAASGGHREVIRLLLSLKKIDTNIQNKDGDTALITATYGGYERIVNYLLDHESIKPNLANKAGDTALIVAAREGHLKIVDKLINHPNIDVNLRNKADESALLEAVRRERQQIVQPLIDAGAIEPDLEKKVARWQLEQEGVFTEPQFIRSSAKGDIELTEKYLRAGMDINVQDDQGETCLTATTRRRMAKMVEFLLNQPNVDVNLPNTDGVTAVEIAATRDYQEIVKLLQKAGAKMDVERIAKRRLLERGLQFRPDVMIKLAAQGQERLVALFLEAGMHPNAEDARGDTALIEASKNGQKSVIELLIIRNANVNLRNRFNVSALEVAIRSGHSEIAELLRGHEAEEPETTKSRFLDAIETGNIDGIRNGLKDGTPPDAYTEDGEPLLISAVRQRRLDIVKLLIDEEAFVDARDKDQKTALMHAAELSTIDIIHYLVKEGEAKKEEVDADGCTALMLAIKEEQVMAVRSLIDLEANTRARDNKDRSVMMLAKLTKNPLILELLKNVSSQEESLEAELIAAATRGDHSEVEALLKDGANLYASDESENTCLAVAAARGWTKVIEVLKPEEKLVDMANSDKDTPLMQAARGGHLDAVKLLLEKKAEINAFNDREETALLQAAVAGKGHVVKFLANRGANPNLVASGTSPLIEACYHGQLEAVSALVDKKAELNQELAYGFSPLMTAMLAGHEEIVDLLRDKKATLGDLEGQVFLIARDGDDEALQKLDFGKIDLNACDRNGWTALMVASREGHGGIVKILLDASVKTDHKARDGKTTALMLAAINGRTGVLRQLLSKKIDDVSKARALVEAAARGHAEVLRLLVLKGKACVDGLPKGRIPLLEAAKNGHLQTVQVLLGLRADKEKESRNGFTAIMAAQLQKQNEVVELLIESGSKAGLKEIHLLMAAREGKADEVERLITLPNPPKLDARDDKGRTALMGACERGHLKVVQVLLRHYSNESAKRSAAIDEDNMGRTPLMWAAKGGNAQIVHCLLKLCADIHAEAKNRRTAVMEGCKWGMFQVVKLLISKMEDDISRRVAVNHKDIDKHTPLGEALLQEVPGRQSEYEGIISLLEKHGAILGRNDSEFLFAVRECDPDRVKALIDNVDFKKLRLHGKTPLMLCAESGCEDVAQTLFHKGAEVKDVGLSGVTALMLAVKKKQRGMVRLLLDNGADPDQIDSEESSPLIEATQLQNEDCVSELINAGANVNYRNSAGNTALTVAVTKENPRLVRMLLASPRGINLNKLDNERRTALNLAHLRGKLYKIPQQALPPLKKPIPIGFLPNATEIERLLIEAGARKGWNEAELILSTKDGDLAQVQELIGKTDLNTRDIDGSTALLIACRNNETEMARILIAEGANIAVSNQNGRTALLEVAKESSFELAKLILEEDSNLDLNGQDKRGETALLEAARAGKPEIVKLLIDRGANVNTANRRGENPIIEIAKHPLPESICSLLKHGANACARDINHRTAIIEAAKHDNEAILQILLNHLNKKLSSRWSKRKAVINAVDRDAHTAVDWAEKFGFTNCAELLRQQGGMSVNETDFVVFTTPFGACYHRITCGAISYARKNKNLKKRLLRKGIRKQYEFCDRCKPSLAKIDWTC